jgi:hypothetical protein
MLAARVLSDHFEHVTLLDRDVLPDSPEPRKGAPQTAHVHVLLRRGLLIMHWSRSRLPGGTPASIRISPRAPLVAAYWNS